MRENFSYENFMTDSCLFCDREELEVLSENEYCFAVRDINPVTELHTLIISKDHYPTIFDVPGNVLLSLAELAKECRTGIEKIDSTVKGFNFGANCGEVAGQKIGHVHLHLIPRREGDVSPPPALHEA